MHRRLDHHPRPRLHPQDQARDRDHAGEPLVRQLLRHLSRRRRHPDAERRADASACPTRRPARACKPYHDHADVNGGGPHGATNATADINGGKMDGFIQQAERPPTSGCLQHPRSGLQPARRHARRDGLPRRARDPQLLGLRAATSCCRTTCSSRTPRGACRRTCSWSRTGRPSARSTATRSSCTNALHRRSRSGPDADRRASARPPIYAWTDLTYLLHKPGVSWGYYVGTGAAAGLRERRGGRARP